MTRHVSGNERVVHFDDDHRREYGAMDGAVPAASVVSGNRLLGTLPPTSLARLTPHLRLEQLSRLQVLFHSQQPIVSVHFPLTAVVSLVARVESGQTLEVGLVGRDGVAGAATLSGMATSCDGVVQVAGSALRMDAGVLRREMTDTAIAASIARYEELLLARCMQVAACNMFHAVEERCVRWLLTLHDTVAHDQIQLTHEQLAALLGVHRPTVTLALGSLHRAGLIDEERGRVRIVDRRGLEAACCECYRIVRQAQQQMFGS